MNTQVQNLQIYKRVLQGVLVSIFFLACLYMYSVNATVRNIVLRNTLAEDVINLNAGVGKLESVYITLSSGVDFSLAQSLGFKEISKKTYISKVSTSQAVSLSR